MPGSKPVYVRDSFLIQPPRVLSELCRADGEPEAQRVGVICSGPQELQGWVLVFADSQGPALHHLLICSLTLRKILHLVLCDPRLLGPCTELGFRCEWAESEC